MIDTVGVALTDTTVEAEPLHVEPLTRAVTATVTDVAPALAVTLITLALPPCV